MNEDASVRLTAGYDLASTEHGEHAHIFGRHGSPLCGRDLTPDRDPLGTICGNCKHLAERIGLLAGSVGSGEA